MTLTEREALVTVLDWVWNALDNKTEYYDVWEEAMYDVLREDYDIVTLSEEYKQAMKDDQPHGSVEGKGATCLGAACEGESVKTVSR